MARVRGASGRNSSASVASIIPFSQQYSTAAVYQEFSGTSESFVPAAEAGRGRVIATASRPAARDLRVLCFIAFLSVCRRVW